MSFKKAIPLFIIALTFVLFSCKKEPVKMTTLSGKWIEETPNSFKTELEILPDGTLYCTYMDSSGVKVDTGTVEILTEALSINFNFNFGTRNGSYKEESDQLAIPNFAAYIFPATTWFNRN